MPPDLHRDPRARGALLAAAAALGALAVARFAVTHAGCFYDDAYIYFRYVRVAQQGCFYCFNPGGPRVEGVTSPLQFLSLLGVTALGGPLGDTATALGALGVLSAVVAAMDVARRVGRGLAGVFAALLVAGLALDHWVTLNAVTGLETAAAMGLVALLARSALTPGHPGLGALCVLAFLARPEAGVFAALLPMLPAMRSPRRLAPVAAALAAVALARLALFHDLVPNTYHAKSGGTLAHARLGLAYLAEVARGEPLALLAPLALASPAAREGARYVLAGAALWLGFFLRSGGDHFAYGRLAAPLVPALIALGVAGLLDLVATRRRAWTPAVAAAVAVVVALGAWSHAIPPQHGFDNVLRWSRLGVALRQRFPGATLATVPIGAIAFYARTRVIDLVGLTEPRIARHGQRVPASLVRRHWLGHERYDTAWALAQRPDVIVTTRWRDRPWTALAEVSPGFYADRQIYAEIVAGRAPYALYSLAVTPREHWALFVRQGAALPPTPAGPHD